MNLEAALIPLEGRARVRGVCAVSRQGRAGRGGAEVIIRDAPGRRAAWLTPRRVLPDMLRLVVMVVIVVVLIVAPLFLLVVTHRLHLGLNLDHERRTPFTRLAP
jgi:hypothetical protein